ncbi:FMN-binding negative transcriptional regulator [Erythrobacter crassostreae]|uniref:FMN-binding negative transcriptional regulator n=1 Tax=Erythrobacter crassostreae TaxID=2828328 RepID=A0A9X1F383_9SPHN|nr:FMN-binding negative transcriptional regulator [Erythrobacter crassostrea]MBV7259217.1 FMN-binding negative transcriptional regulator [Erythrobacter crassostrea]
MHPNPLFRTEDRALIERLVEQVGFGMVFLTIPDGPRVAHTPILMTSDNRLQFHLARHNALSPHLDGAQALVTVNGPDGYVSPRWYDNRDTVPTWDYAAVEIEGNVRAMTYAELEQFLHAVIEKHEERIAGERWEATETNAQLWDRLAKGITGFEMTITALRPTLKLSQKKSPEERQRIANGHAENGSGDLAEFMMGIAR